MIYRAFLEGKTISAIAKERMVMVHEDRLLFGFKDGIEIAVEM